MRIPKILAPAGDMDSVIAAVKNKADAVYLGGQAFSARASATNFDNDQLTEAVKYAHLHQVAVYVTVNTLLSDEELRAAVKYVQFLYEINVDAVIVQDLALFTLVEKCFPHLRLHASTQMSIHNQAGVEYLQQHGADLVVLAREMQLDDIKKIAETTGAELESFVHGALCICYSGQCLMSSIIGGRSGNRGRCAQPCRLAYSLMAENGKEVQIADGGDYLLSPRDLHSYEIIDQILDAGLTTWKIEGRMKRPEYVGTVTRIYRQGLDALLNHDDTINKTEAQHQLEQIFNRDKTTGYFLQDNGRDLMSWKRPNNRGVFCGRVDKIDDAWLTFKTEQDLMIGDGLEIWLTKGGRQGLTITTMKCDGKICQSAVKGSTVTVNNHIQGYAGDRIFKTYDTLLMTKAQESYKNKDDLAVSFIVNGKQGTSLTLTAFDEEGNTVQIDTGHVVAAARTSPSNYNNVLAQINRLGGSGFVLKELIVHLDENIMLPASVLNQGRRDALSLLIAKRLEKYHKPSIDERDVKSSLFQYLPPTSPKDVNKLDFAVAVNDLAGVEAALAQGIKTIYLNAYNYKGEIDNPENVVLELPRIINQKRMGYWQKKLNTWSKQGFKGVLVDNLGALQLAKKTGWSGKIYGGMGLNVFNSATVRVLAAEGVVQTLLSPELTLEQIQEFGKMPLDLECLIHGRIPLMISEQCVVGCAIGGKTATTPCSRPCQRAKGFSLKDKLGFVFPITTDDDCHMQIFNSRELCLADDLDKIRKSGVNIARLDLRLYEAADVLTIINNYKNVLNGNVETETAIEIFKQLSGTGITKGHYFRGV